MTKIRQLTAGIALVTCTVASTSALAEVSFNVGWASEYYFRGILQKNSSASAGVDYEDSGFYVGTWAADVGDGLEVDLYGGYGIETEAGFSASVGYTGYFYTGEFDDTYQEINLGAGFGMLSVGYSIGQWDGFGNEQDYTFLEATIEHEGFYGTFGSFGDDFDGEYIELGYGVTISDIDFGIAAIFNSDELSDQLDSSGNPDEGQAIIFSIGKTW
jgi:hypothetical protein